MNTILLRLQKFLDEINFGTAKIDPKLIQEFAESSYKYVNASINEPKNPKFTLRMSNLGKSLCMLQAEQKGFEREAPDNFFPLKMLYGGCVEALVMMLLKASGIVIDSEQQPVKSKDGITGTYDCVIEGKLYDVKSCSDYSFNHNFKGRTIQELFENDPFGYTVQLFSYAKEAKVPVGGIIAVNKITGEIEVLQAEYDSSFEAQVFAKIDNTVKVITNNEPFQRCYSDYPEFHYKRASGNRVLRPPCTFCSFKFSCWENLQVIPSLVSTAKNKPITYYTHIETEQTSEK